MFNRVVCRMAMYTPSTLFSSALVSVFRLSPPLPITSFVCMCVCVCVRVYECVCVHACLCVLTLPIANSPLSKKRTIPRKMKARPKVTRPRPISVEGSTWQGPMTCGHCI